MHFKKLYVKIVKSGFGESGCHGNGLIGTGLVFPDKFYEKSPNCVAVAVFVAKIRIFEISMGTLCPPPFPCKIGLSATKYSKGLEDTQARESLFSAAVVPSVAILVA